MKVNLLNKPAKKTRMKKVSALSIPLSKGAYTAMLVLCSFWTVSAQNPAVSINWDRVVATSRTTPTLQVVVNPMLKRGAPIHESSFKALKELGADYVRFVPWFPYPHAAVPQLRRPTKDSTFWNFSTIDPIMEDMMVATKNHSLILNFSTIPDWMFEGEAIRVPNDQDLAFWDYNRGRKLQDTSAREVAAYFARIFSWYTQGGFTDELGRYHESGHHFKIPYWEVLNEPDIERFLSPRLYTRIYDETVKAIKRIDPGVRFIGISVAQSNIPEWFEYFLNHDNHQPGVPIDGISYHFYAFSQEEDEEMKIGRWQYSFFQQADQFLDRVKYIENIRKRLSPETFTDLNELGVILWGKETQTGYNIPGANYWNLAGALYAYLYAELAKMGIEIAGQSQLVGYPGQFPSVTMIDWETGKPNARYWALKLLKDNFKPGDKLVGTSSNAPAIYAQAFITDSGRKLLVLNKRNRSVEVSLPGRSKDNRIMFVDEFTGNNGVGIRHLTADTVVLRPFSIVVVEMGN